MLDKLIPLLGGLNGNIIIPRKNRNDHNYAIGHTYTISRCRNSFSVGNVILSAIDKNGKEGNSILLDEAELIYTAGGVNNALAVISDLKKELQKQENFWLNIQQQMEEAGTDVLDYKKIELEELVKQMREDNLDPATIVSKLMKVVQAEYGSN